MHSPGVVANPAPQSRVGASCAVWCTVAVVVATVAAVIIVAYTVDDTSRWVGVIAGGGVSFLGLGCCLVGLCSESVQARDKRLQGERIRAREALMPTLDSLPLVPPNTPTFAIEFSSKADYEGLRRFWKELIVTDARYANVRIDFVDEKPEVRFYNTLLEIKNFVAMNEFLKPLLFGRGKDVRFLHLADQEKRNALEQRVAQVKVSPHFTADPFFIPSSLRQNFDLDQWLKGHFSKGGSLLAGESHNEREMIRFLRQMMPKFKQWGVRTLVLEAFNFDTMQPDLDELNRTKQMPIMVEHWLKAIDAVWKRTGCGKYELVQEAVSHDMEIVGGEISLFDNFDLGNPDDNVLGRNLSAFPIIKARVRGPYIFVFGCRHGSSNIPSVKAGYREMFHEPLLWVQGGEKESVTMNYQNWPIRVDIAVTLAAQNKKGDAEFKEDKRKE